MQAAEDHILELRARYWNLGSDARIAGLPRTACPAGVPPVLKSYWRTGWESAQQEWGADATWPVRDLPPVRSAS